MRACSLTDDVLTLKGGHDCEIGEQGINLSGGQKARVSLARACYSGATVVMLDDPLAAVDPQVTALKSVKCNWMCTAFVSIGVLLFV